MKNFVIVYKTLYEYMNNGFVWRDNEYDSETFPKQYGCAISNIASILFGMRLIFTIL